jgi:hypothetical protein
MDEGHASLHHLLGRSLAPGSNMSVERDCHGIYDGIFLVIILIPSAHLKAEAVGDRSWWDRGARQVRSRLWPSAFDTRNRVSNGHALNMGIEMG